MRITFSKSIILLVSVTVLSIVNIFCVFSQAPKELITPLTSADSVSTEIITFDDYLQRSTAFSKSDITKALNYGQRAYLISKSEENLLNQYKSLMNLGNITFYAGLYDEAFQFIIKAITISKEIDNFEQTARAFFALGMFRLVLEDYEKAKEHFENSMQEFEKQAKQSNTDIHPRIIALYKNNMGVIFRGLKQYKLSINTLLDGIFLVDSVQGSDELLIQLSTNLGETYLYNEQYEDAREAYLKALELTDNVNDFLLESMVNIGLGDLSMELNELDEAYQLYFKSYKLAEKAGGISHLKHATKRLSSLFETREQLDSVIMYTKLSENYENQLKKREASENITREEMKQIFELAEIELNKELTSNKRNNTRLIIGTIILLLIATQLIRIIYKKYVRANQEKTILEKDHKKSINKLSITESELALKTLQELKQKELIDDIILSIDNSSGDSSETRDFKNKLLSFKDTSRQVNWKDLEIRFNSLHEDFFEKLDEIVPHLTKNERKLCMFIKLDMTTKEIISITGQSVRAVEIARTRLRKKLGLTNSTVHLNDFFKNL